MAAKLTAVLGNCKRTGRWKIRSQTKAFVLFGNCKIDYRDAYADDDLEEIKLDVFCLFGRAVFILPPGANVQPSAVSMLSASKFDVEVTDIVSELPTIKMETTTVFGLCRVQTIDEENTVSDEERAKATSHAPPESDTRVAVERREPTGRAQAPEPELEPALPPPLPAELLNLSIDGELPTAAPTLPPTEIAVGENGPGEGADHGGQTRLDDLDPAKAVLITEETETVHISAGVDDSRV